MSRTDNTMPWRLKEEDAPHLNWKRVINQQMVNDPQWRGWLRRETRRWWHAERRRVRNDLRPHVYDPHWDTAPAPTRTRSSIRWDLW